MVQTNSGEVGGLSDTIQIEASIIPLASIVNRIGGNMVEVHSIVPVGVSPHAFDLKPNQMQDIQNADLIIYFDLDHIDAFLDKAIGDKEVLRVASGIDYIETSPHVDEEEDKEIGHEEGHTIDPHIWNSTENAIIIAEEITQKLSTLRPDKKLYFETNLESFKTELSATKNEFILTHTGMTVQKFIIFHDAYNYFFQELGIPNDQKIVFQKTVLSDPNSNEMKAMIDQIIEYKVSFGFREPQIASPNLEKLASDYAIDISVLNPLGTDDSSGGYITNYRNNLEALKNIYR